MRLSSSKSVMSMRLPSLSHRASFAFFTFFVVFANLFCIDIKANASELSYKPINPNFGGNSFNDGILLGTANVQNPYEREREVIDPTEQFVQSLQSRVFSGLARQISDSIFGENPQEEGVFTVGDQQVSFERGAEAISIEINNLADGSSTVIELPVVDIE